MKRLVAEAKKARTKAYAPFSKYKVGAALETAAGKIFTGCNVENSSYGLSNCAERTALFKAISEGARHFTRIAIVTSSATPATPCGACLQVLSEFAPNLDVIVANLRGNIHLYRLSDLLPKGFRMKSN